MTIPPRLLSASLLWAKRTWRSKSQLRLERSPSTRTRSRSVRLVMLISKSPLDSFISSQRTSLIHQVAATSSLATLRRRDPRSSYSRSALIPKTLTLCTRLCRIATSWSSPLCSNRASMLSRMRSSLVSISILSRRELPRSSLWRSPWW